MSSQKIQNIADLARVAGVSKSTVSRALNDSPLIGAETKERIRAIAREHRFQMNAPARRLSQQKANAIALVTYEYAALSDVPDAFVLELMSGVSAALAPRETDLLVVSVNPYDTGWIGRYLGTGRADGFILLAATCTPVQLRALATIGAPFIVWGDIAPGQAYSTVTGDSFGGGHAATAHLLARGRRRIAFLGGPADAREVRDRFLGYESALQAAGIDVDPSLVVHASWKHRETAGAAAMEELLARAPELDAVFSNSDVMAMAAMEVLREHGRRVPDDVAVVGYDDISIARYANPPLTTIRQNAPLVGRLLAENLLQHIETGAVTAASLPAELVVRKST